MRHALFPVLLTAFTLVLVGCQTSSLVDLEDPERRSAAVSTEASAYPISAGADLGTLVSEALAHHPSLVAAEHKITRLQARVPQEESLPDPAARLGLSTFSSSSSTNTSLGLEQTLPYPGKLLAKGKSARKEVDAARAELEHQKLIIAERVRTAYWNYYLATQTQRINQESQTILNDIQESVQAQVIANQATQADLLRSTTEINKIKQQLIVDRQRIKSSQASLNALLNRPANSSLPSPKRASLPSLGDLDKLIAEAEARHPSVTAGQARVAAFQQHLKSAQLHAYPDFLVGAEHTWGSNSTPIDYDETALTFGVTLPVWQEPRRAKIREAEAGIAEMQADVAASRSELRLRIEDAWFQAKSAREMLTLFEQRLIPDAKQAYESSLKAYSTGGQSFVDVLDTWRLYLSFQLQQENNHALLGKATAALQSAAAIP